MRVCTSAPSFSADVVIELIERIAPRSMFLSIGDVSSDFRECFELAKNARTWLKMLFQRTLGRILLHYGSMIVVLNVRLAAHRAAGLPSSERDQLAARRAAAGAALPLKTRPLRA